MLSIFFLTCVPLQGNRESTFRAGEGKGEGVCLVSSRDNPFRRVNGPPEYLRGVTA